VCNKLHEKDHLDPILSVTFTVVVLAPMVVQDSGNRTRRLVFCLKQRSKLLGFMY
jgi:hypothetical protein